MRINQNGQSGLIGADLGLSAAEGQRASGATASIERASNAGDAREAQRSFETYFSTQMVKELRRGLSSGFFGDGAGSDTYDSWFDDFLGKALADAGALDLSGLIKTMRAAGDAPQDAGGPK